MPDTPGYVPMRTIETLLTRPKPWVWTKLALYRDAPLVALAKRWHQRRQHHPRSKPKNVKTPILVHFVNQVGVPERLFQRLLWDALQEDWAKLSARHSRRGRHTRAIYQLNNWAALSDPSSPAPLLVPPPSSSRPSTTSSASRRPPNRLNSTARP